jgi:acyl dehydratase
MAGPLFYEDFRVGQRFASSTRSISEADLRAFTALSGDGAAVHVDADYARSVGFDAPVVHGPLGIAVVFGLLYDQGIVEPTAIAMLDLDWRFRAPIVAGDSVRFELTVTRCRRARNRDAGVVNRHFSVVNQKDAVVQEGTSAMLVRAREPHANTDPAVATDFCSRPWAEALGRRLASNEAFVRATGTFDGSIGLQAGREGTQLRVYRGELLECARSTPCGPTFTLAGDELAWTELVGAPRNDFVARATKGRFSVSGNAFEYLRMTKAVVAIWDSIRELAADGRAT